MSETLAELAETDALLTALVAAATRTRTGDPVVDALSGWVDEISSHPVPRVESRAAGRSTRARPAAGLAGRCDGDRGGRDVVERHRRRRDGDPLAPFNYVATALGHLAPDGPAADPASACPRRSTGARARGRIAQASQTPARLTQTVRPGSCRSHGRHRAPDARRRAVASAATGIESAEHRRTATDTDYTPRHVATGESPTRRRAAPRRPRRLRAETPPVETPPAETPPVDRDPPPADARSGARSRAGPMAPWSSPAWPGARLLAADSDAAEPSRPVAMPRIAQVAIGEDAPAETPADRAPRVAVGRRADRAAAAPVR